MNTCKDLTRGHAVKGVIFGVNVNPECGQQLLQDQSQDLSSADEEASGRLSQCPDFVSPGQSGVMVSALVLVPEDLTSSIMAARPSMALALGHQQGAGLARAATLEQLREKLETCGGGEAPERKMARLAEEQQRFMQQAFQHNLLAMASHMPMNLRLGGPPISRGQCCTTPQVCVRVCV